MFTDHGWQEPEIIRVPEDYRSLVGGHPLVAETLFRRGIHSPQAVRAFLDPNLYLPSSPFELQDLRSAVDLVTEAVSKGTAICVWGDFDVDGQSSTTLLVEALRGLGANVRYYIPDREVESHGFHPASLRLLLEQGIGLVITCDTGVTGQEAVDVAREFGAQVIITDHHDLPSQLPSADAVINPKRLPPEHPMRELPGVGVAYELAKGTFLKLGLEFPEPELLELTALGIVSDLAVQTGDVRYLLQRGLAAMRMTSRPALLSLFQIAKLNPEEVDEEQITFGIAPRLNSLGRLSDANQGVEFLSSRDRLETDEMAAGLDQLNTKRKLLTDQVFQAAVDRLEKDKRSTSPVLVVSGVDWPRGVLGIVASRLVETYGKPAIVLSEGSDGMLGGSARSVPAVDISAAISSTADLVERYGGHPMAAGLLLKADQLVEFDQRIRNFVLQHYGQVEPPALQLDGYLPLSDLDLGMMRDFARLAPFGPGNPGLVFASRGHEIVESRFFGTAQEHLKIIVRDDDGGRYELIRWRGKDLRLPRGRVDIAYSTRINSYRGADRLQLEWVDTRDSEPFELVVTEQVAQIKIADWRWILRPEEALAELVEPPSIQVWREGILDRTIAGCSRSTLQAAARLVIWTAPANRAILLEAIERVQPQELIFVGREPGTGQFEIYARQLAGMVKYALQNLNGRFDVRSSAERLGSSIQTVRSGVDYLTARGTVRIKEDSIENLQLAAGAGEVGQIESSAQSLRQNLMEEYAFRAYVRKCDLQLLVQEG
jgi:single-stranded-DNA-specific exonuclease